MKLLLTSGFLPWLMSNNSYKCQFERVVLKPLKLLGLYLGCCSMMVMDLPARGSAHIHIHILHPPVPTCSEPSPVPKEVPITSRLI